MGRHLMISIRRMVWLLDNFSRKCGPLLALIAPLLIIVIGWTYLFIVVYQREHTILLLVHILLTAHLFLLILFNFYKSVTCNVKYIPSDSDDELEFPICSICLVRKGERVHHCSVCNSCTRNMDHHCPWINNWY